MNKSAIVTGITGMDGSIITEQLLELDYTVYGLIRRSAKKDPLGNISHLENNLKVKIVEGDLTDLSSLCNLCNLAKADLFFHLGAMSHVGTSFKQPTATMEINAGGTLNCLEAIRLSGIHTRFLNAATSELYGGISERKSNEETPFYPKSPYGISKLGAFWATKNYRESYKMFACSSICFNHEHHRRHESFVTRKITKAAAKIKLGKQDNLYLGNLEARRDWGWAPDFTNGMIDMLTKNTVPKDYVMATGQTHSVKDFCKAAFEAVDLNYQNHVLIDPQFYRPCEVDVLIGDYSNINKDLGWKPSITFNQLVQEMVQHDLKLESIEKS